MEWEEMLERFRLDTPERIGNVLKEVVCHHVFKTGIETLSDEIVDGLIADIWRILERVLRSE